MDKRLTELFITLGPAEAKLGAADQKDVEKMGYTNQQEVLAQAEELLTKFSGRREAYKHHGFELGRGLVFAFPNEEGTFDLLIAHDSHMVYRATEIAFVSNGRKSVLKSPKETVCVTDGRSVIIKGDYGFSSLTSIEY